ncbi:MAG: FAD-dependent monooxygenase, partial [Minwuiales bacterium]|nr:FAD-dependent monooxygenase [Minwuiales bacterium]
MNAKQTLRTDVVIVGGGMAGLSLACASGGAGLDCVVIDREDPATAVDAAFDGRVSALAHATCQMFKGLGIWAHVSEAQPILDIRVSDGDSLLFLHYDHRDLGDEPFGHMVENRVTRLALLARIAELPTVRLLAPAGVTDVRRDAARSEVHLADGTVVSAPLCVGADGRNSPLRQSAGIKCAAWSYH